MPDIQLYMSEAGDVEYMLINISCAFSEADTAMGQAFGTVISGACLGVLLCEVSDPDEVDANVQTYIETLPEIISCITNFDSATDAEKQAGLTSYGSLANHESCVGIQASADGMLNLMFIFAPKGTRFD
ncbi:MAG: hypothetical protein ACI4O7_06810 [Aristaeellaceae bacterium]